jgi:hypothetical protein
MPLPPIDPEELLAGLQHLALGPLHHYDLLNVIECMCAVKAFHNLLRQNGADHSFVRAVPYFDPNLSIENYESKARAETIHDFWNWSRYAAVRALAAADIPAAQRNLDAAQAFADAFPVAYEKGCWIAEIQRLRDNINESSRILVAILQDYRADRAEWQRLKIQYAPHDIDGV